MIEARPLAPDAASRAVALILEQGLDAWLYVGNDWLLRDPKAPHVDREAWTVKFDPTVVDDLTQHLDGVAKVVGVSDDHDRVAACEGALKAALGSGASAARSQPYYVDVTHPQANKGAVGAFLSERLGVPTGEIATIGDMPNDVLMFEPSGFSIAMGNASAEVQARADVVTASHREDGFALAVERYLLT